MAYTYLIGWSEHNKWYYGVRYAKKSNPTDLWKKYFTSSKYVKDFRAEFGEPEVIQVRKKFSSDESALMWEYKVLRRINAVKSNMWLNRGNGGKEFKNTKPNEKSFIKGQSSIGVPFKKGMIPWNIGLKGDLCPYKLTEDRNNRVSNSLKRKYIVTHPDGRTETILGIIDFCNRSGISAPRLLKYTKNKKTYKGYSIERIDTRPSAYTN
jgi:hypothetical protein